MSCCLNTPPITIIRNSWHCPDHLRQAVIIVGNMDGVHRGHQELLRHGKELAQQLQRPLAVLTFEPHPLAILYPQKAPKRLTDLRTKLHWLHHYGVDYFYQLPFTQTLAQMSAVNFIEHVLKKTLQAAAIIVGEDFRFGYQRQGNTELLKQHLSHDHIPCHALPIQYDNEHTQSPERFSSSSIRHLLQQGQLAKAQRLLGHPHRWIGRVISGYQLGRKLGFPTANIELQQRCPLPFGVYTTHSWIPDDRGHYKMVPSIASFGVRPAVHTHQQAALLEVHLLSDKPIDLYGKYIATDWLHYLRSERYFPDFDALTHAITHDVTMARQWHQQHPNYIYPQSCPSDF
jgi:riboflavin kinase/FMN adenylyltransferase